ncbi:hypothetical protein SAMN05216337_10934 [Bradyrhizobium brasilense]|uniref:Uncharacterized protein n=1 Tax=Bradyrhizobium brasilense TaxID=1419277 RepID=A0A1G7Q8Z4_9BRAD|nr:hypothetical protein [Bradyrhizobium brasilense]SDF94963.1 hypothetical protein SAMN05216337_10934 [Bradyrhizobium brasilense]
MTTTELAKAVLAAHAVEDATVDDVQGIAPAVQHSLKNHEGKGVERVGEASPAAPPCQSRDPVYLIAAGRPSVFFTP